MMKKLLAAAFVLSSASSLHAINLDAYSVLVNNLEFQNASSSCQISSIELTEKTNVSTTWEYHFSASGHYDVVGLNGRTQSTPCVISATVKSIGGATGNSWFVEDVRPVFALASTCMGF